jgi:hypothetical protein
MHIALGVGCPLDVLRVDTGEPLQALLLAEMQTPQSYTSGLFRLLRSANSKCNANWNEI